MENKDLIYIYGVNPVKEALKVPYAVKEILISKSRLLPLREIIETAEKCLIPVRIVDEKRIQKIVQGVHQGVLAKVIPKDKLDLTDALKIPSQKREPPFFLILDLIEDPQNFGAILRVAEAVGVHAVIYQQRRSVGIVPSVWKSSAGAVWHVNLVEINNIKYAIREFKERDITIIGAEADGGKTLWEASLNSPIAIVIGSEGSGIRQTVRELCDEIVKIPMKGKINSLNVSTATSVLLFEVMRQRSLSV
ncbi:MAG: 23S rRNA (guanosine(2251)-2'-O)-methyltransferase RlmB [Thermodesulfovibrio sp.]|uniref:23S rRNA (guanosine(2251)-2'-O)-methyltransferase RlmB n=1 Tax=Thermodesulfovibrio sp. 1176 TaxID=3043424 RepID=UPI00248312DD|nr:23S rRNA (guanosine(2251)-2'-O)-methyltransferase RlmB [Thermodesulfovibrio sp. 1176]MDI1471777.1 23S rRNA (guanosine(2251)-2'-O)-methyltransferase RlmB [Thermodesulfovibrio sp. 1176]MDI6713667.1 23S rRNA (guanosine(2251)-2'-O)-methyltransferase RlmB [Thermodesulfovibrio sp.]